MYFKGNLDSANNSANSNDIRLRHCVNQVMPRSWRCWLYYRISGRSVSCFEDIDRGLLESLPPPQSGKQKKKKRKTVWIQARKEGSATGALTSPKGPQRSTLLLINYLRRSELIVFFILIHSMCSKIENTVRELTTPLTLSTKYILTVVEKYIKKGIW